MREESLPAQIGGHPVLRVLGSGAMGRVYLARHERLGIEVAIKVLLDRDPDLLGRFEREAEVMARTKHPNVLEVYEAGLNGGAPYLVMEYCPGQDLAQLSRERGALPPEEAATLVAAAARGLAAVHAAGAIHRDVKPANLLLTPEGKLKVADFGLARAGLGRTLTQTGVVMGTPAFMAPEQLRDARLVDARSDVYALGAVLFQLLSGRPPVSGGSLMVVADKVLRGELERLDERVPAELREIARCALSLDPGDRYSSAELLAEALESCSAPAATPRLQPLLRGGAGGALLALTLGLSLLALLGSARIARAPAASPLATSPPTAASSSPSDAPTSSAPLELIQTPAGLPRRSRPLSPAEARALVAERGAAEAYLLGTSRELERALERGEPAALCALGRAHLGGLLGREPDRTPALAAFRRAAEAGSVGAMTDYACLLLASRGVTSSSAREWLERAILGGHARASWFYAQALASDRTRALELALEVAQEAFAAGDPEAALILAEGCERRAAPEERLTWIARAAAQGDRSAIATLDLGRAESQDLQVRAAARARLEVGVRLGLIQALDWRAQRLIASGAPAELEEAKRLLRVAALNGLRGAATSLSKLVSDPQEAIALLQKDVHAGHTRAQGLLAIRLLKSPSPPTHAEALALLEASAALPDPDPEVLLYLGIALQKGNRELKRSTEVFGRASKAGLPAAHQAFGHALFHGLGCERDPARGIALLERAAEQGQLSAYRVLGACYQESPVVAERDLARAERWYRQGADRGDPHCFLLLGDLAEQAEDLPRARAIYEEGAQAGDPGSLRRLGLLAREAGDLAAAVSYLEAAAAKGDVDSLRALAVLAERGGDPALFRRRLEAAAAVDDPDSLRALADLEARANNYTRARELLLRAKARGDLHSEAALGKWLIEGRGGPAAPREGLKLLEGVARRGYFPAALELAVTYRTGTSVPRDLGLANESLDLAERLAKTPGAREAVARERGLLRALEGK